MYQQKYFLSFIKVYYYQTLKAIHITYSPSIHTHTHSVGRRYYSPRCNSTLLNEFSLLWIERNRGNKMTMVARCDGGVTKVKNFSFVWMLANRKDHICFAIKWAIYKFLQLQNNVEPRVYMYVTLLIPVSYIVLPVV